MKILLITVAGMSERFSKSLGRACLKCIYYKNNIQESLLYRMLHHNASFDYFVIVGGFKYEELKAVLEQEFQDVKDKIILVNNTSYAEYGSGYSLYLGIKAIEYLDYQELIFAEGDLFVDEESFLKICQSQNSVITSNKEEILAEKAVAFYYDLQYGVHYIYDTAHKVLEINEPFRGIFNSGQIWKFTQISRLRKIVAGLSKKEYQGTNLVLIQKYFDGLTAKDYEIIRFKKWINCNTIEDFERIC